MKLFYVKAGLLLTCLGGFIWQIFDHVRKFLDEKTTEASSWESTTHLNFPMFVICDERGFKGTALMTKHPYPSVAHNVTVGIEKVLTLNESTWPNHTMEDLPTLYNGNCQKIIFHDSYPFRVAVGISLKSEQSYQMFLINPGTELYLVTQDHIRTPSMIEVTHPMIIEMWKTQYIEKEVPCLKNIVEQDQLQCIKERIRTKLKANPRITCLPFPIERQIGTLPVCGNQSELDQVYPQVQDLISKTVYDYKGIGCFTPCTEEKFNTKVVHLGKYATHSKDSIFVYSLFVYEGINVRRQYRLMDFQTIVAAVGGSLSLFLGVSCFGITWKCIEKAHARISP